MAVELGTVAAIGFDDFPRKTWLDCFRRLGCTRVQAYRNTKVDPSVPQMRDYIEAGGMPCDSLHGIFGEEYDPSCPDETKRQFAVDTYKREGDLALALGGPLVVVHCCTIRREGIPDDERCYRVQQLKKSIRELGDFGAANGIRYAFENLPRYHPVGWDVPELVGILDSVNHPATGLCFDTGHAHMVGDSPAALRTTASQLLYVHLSDNSGAADTHQMPTDGSLDCDEIGRALHEVDYDGTVMLEVFYDVNHLERLIDNGWTDRLAHIIDLANGRAD